MTRILAIGPGSASAAWAIIDPENGLSLTDDVPVANRMVDAAGFAHVVESYRPAITRLLRGALCALRVPLHEASPSRLKCSHGIGCDKEKACALAIRFYPRVPASLARKRDAGRAEALLLARWFAELHK